MPNDARELLRDQQSRLLASLRGKADVPDGFDAARVSLAGATLISKRQRAVARCWPALPATLNDTFPALFQEYAAEVSPSAGGEALRDVEGFVNFLQERGKLPEAVAMQYLCFKARRRLFAIARVGTSGTLAIAIRIPGFGTRAFRLF